MLCSCLQHWKQPVQASFSRKIPQRHCRHVQFARQDPQSNSRARPLAEPVEDARERAPDGRLQLPAAPEVVHARRLGQRRQERGHRGGRGAGGERGERARGAVGRLPGLARPPEAVVHAAAAVVCAAGGAGLLETLSEEGAPSTPVHIGSCGPCSRSGRLRCAGHLTAPKCEAGQPTTWRAATWRGHSCTTSRGARAPMVAGTRAHNRTGGERAHSNTELPAG
jgi:hypothetical protein